MTLSATGAICRSVPKFLFKRKPTNCMQHYDSKKISYLNTKDIYLMGDDTEALEILLMRMGDDSGNL